MCTNHMSTEQGGPKVSMPGTNEKGTGDFTDIYERYEVQLQKEDELTNNRVKWLLGTQTILFAAIKVGNSNPNPKILEAVRFVGLASSIAIGISILASTLCFAKHRKRLIEKFESVRNGIRKTDYPQLDRCGYVLFLWETLRVLPCPLFLRADGSL